MRKLLMMSVAFAAIYLIEFLNSTAPAVARWYGDEAPPAYGGVETPVYGAGGL